MANLTEFGKITRVINATAAGTSDINGSIIDMAGYDNCTFIVGFGTITAGATTSIKVQQDSAAGGGTMADLAGTKITVADDDDNQVAVVEVKTPAERYLRVVVDRGTQNAVVDFGIAIQTNAKSQPVTHDSSTVIGTEIHHGPAEGTA